MGEYKLSHHRTLVGELTCSRDDPPPAPPLHSGHRLYDANLDIEQGLAQSNSIYQHKARKIYNELRRNIVTTVFESWRATGFAWEQYNPETGAGQRTQHFTGWTALVVKIMALPDLDSDVPARDLGRDRDWWNKKQVVFALGILLMISLLMRRKVAKVFRTALG